MKKENAPEPSFMQAAGVPLWIAVVVVLGTMALAWNGMGLDDEYSTGFALDRLMPFLATLVGVSLYMMGVTKTHKERFDYRYLPDYCYRIAQSVVYTYVVLAIMAQVDVGVVADTAPHAEQSSVTATPSPTPTPTPTPTATTLGATSTPTPSPSTTPTVTQSPAPTTSETDSGSDTTNPKTDKDFSRWPPVLVGLMIGLFILHVEKAMEGFGERFGEALSALLGRSLEGRTPREKQMDRIRDEKKLEEIRQQAELMASQAPGRAVLVGFQKRIAEVTGICRDGEANAIHDAVTKLAWEFEQIKVALREETTTVAEILGRSTK